MTKKVLYYMHSLCRSRVMKTFGEDPDLIQIIVGPEPREYDNIKEGYDDFGIKDIRTYKNVKEAQKHINTFAPDIIVQTDMMRNVNFPKNAKKVFVMHGDIGNHVTTILDSKSLKHWRGFDLYCGASENFRNLVKHATGKSDKVILNALPQFDLFHESNYSTFNKNVILKKTKNHTAEKIILFYGFCCKKRKDYNDHNEDYFKILIELNKIASKHNWVVLVKPRQNVGQIQKFIKSEKWATKYNKTYSTLLNSRFIHFIHPDASIYNYFSSDLIIGNGYSTLEIEACLANKPLVLVRTRLTPDKYDPFGTATSGAAYYVQNISELEKTIIHGLSDTSYIIKQNAFITSRGIIVDGFAAKRIQEKIKLL